VCVFLHGKNADKTKQFITDHFIREGFSKTTIYRILKRKESGIGYIGRLGSGRPAKYSANLVYLKLSV
jgi:hypothetical protein